jgi:hypothetical protein
VTDDARLAALLAEIRLEFPRFRLVPKEESRLQRAIAQALRALTFGGQNAYLDRYVTTIGRTVYVNRGWESRTAADQYITLRHERIHLRQFRRYGLIPMALAYLLLPLPVGLAWCRARLEWEAYAESVRAMRDVYGDAHALAPDTKRYIIEQFTGPAYGWMWPFPRQIQSWLDMIG